MAQKSINELNDLVTILGLDPEQSNKFYKLSHEEWKQVNKVLKPVEISLLYYIRTLDPFGTYGLQVSITDIAKEIGANRSTISRALKVLDEHGYINLKRSKTTIAVNSIPNDQRKQKTRSRHQNSEPKPNCDPKVTKSLDPIDLPPDMSVVRSHDHAVRSFDHGMRSHDHANTSEIESEQSFQNSLDQLDFIEILDRSDQEEFFDFEAIKNIIEQSLDEPILQEQLVDFDEQAEFLEAETIEEIAEIVDRQPNYEQSESLVQEEQSEIDISEDVSDYQYQERIPENQAPEPTILRSVPRPITKDQKKQANNQETTTKTGEKSQAIAVDDPDRDLKKFIVKTIESQKGRKILLPDAYTTKCLKNDREHWEALYAKSLRPKSKSKEDRFDCWRVETSLMSALQSKNYEFAIARFNDYPEFHEVLLERHPNWKELLTETMTA
jgi:DNA-binding transcriptional ArsR family regulator